MFCDLAVLVLFARVAELLADAPLEEALAALTTDGPVMPTYTIIAVLLLLTS